MSDQDQRPNEIIFPQERPAEGNGTVETEPGHQEAADHVGRMLAAVTGFMGARNRRTK